MAVDEHGGRARCATPFRQHDWMPGRVVNAGLQTRSLALVGKPRRSVAHVRVVLRASAHARNSQKLEQLRAETFLIIPDVSVHVSHYCPSSSRRSASAL